MAAQYHSLFTTQGLALLREAIQTGAKLGITHMAYGDGNGIVPTPNADFTKLVKEVYRTPLNRLAPSKENSNWLEADGVIPSAVGGFNIREVGLYAGNVLVAYANYPATYKPSADQGTAQIKTIRIVLQIDNTANFELKIDASVVMATIQSVEDAKLEAIKDADETKVHVVSSVEELQTIEKWNGRTALVKSYWPNLNKGGGEFIYDSSKKDINDGGMIINGWVRRYVTATFEMFGAKGNTSNFDDSSYINKALEFIQLQENGFIEVEKQGVIYYISKPIIFNGSEAYFLPRNKITVDFSGSKFIPTVNNLTCIVLNQNHVKLINGHVHNHNGNSNITALLFGSLTPAIKSSTCFCRVDNFIAENVKVGVRSQPAASINGSTSGAYYNEMYSPTFMFVDTAFWMDGNPLALDNQNTRFTIFNPRHVYGKCTFQLDCNDTFNVFGGSSEFIVDEDRLNGAVIHMPKRFANHTIDNQANFTNFTIEACTRLFYSGSWALGLLNCNTIAGIKPNITDGGRECIEMRGRLEVVEDRSDKSAYISAMNTAHNCQFFMGVTETGTPLMWSDNIIKITQKIDQINTNNIISEKVLSSGQLNIGQTGKATLILSGDSTNLKLWNGGGGNIQFGGTPALTAFGDNQTSLGVASNRWIDIYAVNGVIQTSDERLKQQFTSLDEAERNAAIEIKQSIKKYKFNHAVDLKGDGARWHIGVSAQNIINIMQAYGLEPLNYAFICFDEWDEETEEIVQNENYIDEDGNHRSREINTGKLQVTKGAGNRYAVRYDELAMFIISSL